MRKVILTVPVYNEEEVLEENIKRIISFFKKNFKYPYTIIIADNGSVDRTNKIGKKLAKRFKDLEYIFISKKGRGIALTEAWNYAFKKYKADIYAYCDVDLATDISYLKELFDGVSKGNNVVIGSRYLKNSNSKRRIGRLILSKGYIYFLKTLFKTKISDFQCGFKAIDNKIVKEILPIIKDKEWFFDTELLLQTEYAKKYKIKQIPVKWNESKDSKVEIPHTIYDYIKKSILLRRRLKNS